MHLQRLLDWLPQVQITAAEVLVTACWQCLSGLHLLQRSPPLGESLSLLQGALF